MRVIVEDCDERTVYERVPYRVGEALIKILNECENDDSDIISHVEELPDER